MVCAARTNSAKAECQIKSSWFIGMFFSFIIRNSLFDVHYSFSPFARLSDGNVAVRQLFPKQCLGKVQHMRNIKRFIILRNIYYSPVLDKIIFANSEFRLLIFTTAGSSSYASLSIKSIIVCCCFSLPSLL